MLKIQLIMCRKSYISLYIPPHHPELSVLNTAMELRDSPTYVTETMPFIIALFLLKQDCTHLKMHVVYHVFFITSYCCTTPLFWDFFFGTSLD